MTDSAVVPERPIRAVVCGAKGRMGQEIIAGLRQDPAIAVVGGCDPLASDADPSAEIPIVASLDALLSAVDTDVVVDFTTAAAAVRNAATCLAHHLPIIIGTTGISKADLGSMEEQARSASTAVLVAPNFAIGAVLMMQFAQTASRFFDTAEIIEAHHEAKIDAPSGTALIMAELMRAERDTAFASDHVEKVLAEGARGGVHRDVHIHSLRMPGFVASHEVVFGGPGQTLRIRHDSIGRDSFVPGVAYAVKNIAGRVGLVYGLDQLIDFNTH